MQHTTHMMHSRVLLQSKVIMAEYNARVISSIPRFPHTLPDRGELSRMQGEQEICDGQITRVWGRWRADRLPQSSRGCVWQNYFLHTAYRLHNRSARTASITGNPASRLPTRRIENDLGQSFHRMLPIAGGPPLRTSGNPSGWSILRHACLLVPGTLCRLATWGLHLQGKNKVFGYQIGDYDREKFAFRRRELSP